MRGLECVNESPIDIKQKISFLEFELMALKTHIIGEELKADSLQRQVNVLKEHYKNIHEQEASNGK